MELNFRSNSRMLAETAIIASLYIILTVSLPGISYWNVQFRISEVLMVLVLFRRTAVPGLILGCFVANLFSPFGLPDVLFGTLGTILAVWGIRYLKGQPVWIALMPAVLFNGLLVGAELQLFANIPFWLGGLQVLAGEAGVLYLVGLPFVFALKKINFRTDW